MGCPAPRLLVAGQRADSRSRDCGEAAHEEEAEEEAQNKHCGAGGMMKADCTLKKMPRGCGPRRVILRTIDGRVVVRPKAPEYVTFYDKHTGEPTIGATLTKEGKAIWNSGEPLNWEWGLHFISIYDIRALSRVDFS